jgi:hypothetical protein
MQNKKRTINKKHRIKAQKRKEKLAAEKAEAKTK